MFPSVLCPSQSFSLRWVLKMVRDTKQSRLHMLQREFSFKQDIVPEKDHGCK